MKKNGYPKIDSLKIGETIQGREFGPGWWEETRLTLLWRGESVLVWRQWSRSDHEPGWADRGESANWTLLARPWRKVKARKP